MLDFVLQIKNKAEFDPLIAKYNQRDSENKRKNKPHDQAALDAGERIRNGDINIEDILYIYKWKNFSFSKTVKGFTDYNQNNFKEITEAFSIAISSKYDRSAIAILCGMNYVKIATASAFLAMMYPDRFTIIDVHALKALGHGKIEKTMDTYLEYNNYCKANYMHYTNSLRDFDRALWQWGKTNSSPKIP